MAPLLLIIVAGSLLFGLAVGSFLAARVIRTAKELPANLMGRSHCLSCQKTLTARDLIPLASYLFLRGKCRHCSAPISPLYLCIELATALGFGLLLGLGLLAGVFPLPLDTQSNLVFLAQSALTLCVFSVLLFVSAVDLIIYAFPVRALAVLTVIALLSSAFTGYPVGLSDALLGGLLFAGALALVRLIGTLLRGIEAMGEGDLWVAALVGVYLGVQKSIVAFYVAFIVGALVALFILLRKKKKTQSAMLPFAPFLALGWGVAFLYGPSLFRLLFPF